MKEFKEELDTYCELYWWDFGIKTLSFKGCLKDLLKKNSITFTIRKTETEGIYKYNFKNCCGISFIVKGTKLDFKLYAKQFMQMVLVRMGDKAQLYVTMSWRPTVTVNF